MTTLPEKLRHSLPPKKHGRLMRNLRWTWLSVYYRLHLIVLLPNILTIVVLGLKHGLLNMPTSDMALVVAVNITAAISTRQELVINMLFAFFGKCPHWLPLRIRRMAAKAYHLGGVHSGAATPPAFWYTPLIVVVLTDHLQNDPASLTVWLPPAI